MSKQQLDPVVQKQQKEEITSFTELVVLEIIYTTPRIDQEKTTTHSQAF